MKWSEMKWVTVRFLGIKVSCTLGDLILRILDYIVTISFWYMLYCVCFNLYCRCFNLFCVCVCVCGVCVVCGCVCVCSVCVNSVIDYLWRVTKYRPDPEYEGKVWTADSWTPVSIWQNCLWIGAFRKAAKPWLDREQDCGNEMFTVSYQCFLPHCIIGSDYC